MRTIAATDMPAVKFTSVLKSHLRMKARTFSSVLPYSTEKRAS